MAAKLVWPAAKKSIFITISDSHNEASVFVVDFTAPKRQRDRRKCGGKTTMENRVLF